MANVKKALEKDLAALTEAHTESKTHTEDELIEIISEQNSEIAHLMTKNMRLAAKAKGRKTAVSQLNYAVLRLKAEKLSMQKNMMQDFNELLVLKKMCTQLELDLETAGDIIEKLDPSGAPAVDTMFIIDPDQIELPLDNS